jgi:sodium/proline symporter
MNGLILAFIAYLAVLIIIGLIFYKQSNTESSFVSGNRSLNYWVTAISAQTSDMGSWLFIAYPAVVYTNGLFEIWTAVGLWFVMLLNWVYIAPKIRAETETYNSLTLSDYFANRLNDKTDQIKILSAIISIAFFIFYISSGFVGLGRVFESAFNIDYVYGLIIGLFITLSYTLIGGFLAVSWCNLFQGILLLAIILFVPTYALFLIGGCKTVVAAAAAKNISLALFPSFSKVGNALRLIFGFGLGYFGQPHILVNFMGIKDKNKIKYAARVGLIWQIFALFGAVMIAFVSIGFFQNGGINNEHLFVEMVKQLFSSFVAGFALCGILAAILSTVTTQTLVATANLSEDLYKTSHPKASSKQLLWISRVGIIGITAISFLLALTNNESIYNLVLYAWSGLGSAFGPLLILCLYTKIPTKQGAIAGLLTGALTAGLWPLINSTTSPLIPGFALSLAAIILLSNKA